ncbi:copper-binding protein [Rariglobus hedericola]|uniref:Copper-binding protein n=1 Tax=Rariglobus hedericola TaxID=2597822 RepID=A0A556QEL7_9BACT|nr:copper-binding protein [Rariglobus hedericola]TSJ75051.1 copper-binding protein [Rariglobus hedericola]
MKSVFLILLISSFLTRASADDCCAAPVAGVAATGTEKEIETAPARHPLKGVVLDVLAEKSALLVKHEEIPGVMKAMTMLLKVDAETLKSDAAKKGAAITGQLVRKTDGWWLESSVIAK